MLSDTKARKIKPDDRPLADGIATGLYLYPTKSAGTGKWILRFKSPETGKRRDMGLGSYPATPVKDARNTAIGIRKLIESGRDPIEERIRLAKQDEVKLVMPTFAEAARQVHADLSPGFRNEKHAAQWITTLETYVFPVIGKREVAALSASDFARALKPIWLTKAETASRVKQRCDAVMNWCAAKGFVTASPVGVVTQLLPKQPNKVTRVHHHPAVSWQEVPGFVSSVLRGGVITPTKLMLEILILTAARSGEVREMEWSELDLEKGIWTVPAQRMKARALHRVPLSAHLITVLEAQRGACNLAETPLVFSSRKKTLLSDMTLTKCLRDHKVTSDTPGRIATAHGFRSSFRDWASENGYARDLAERALAHTIKSATEAAYHRTDLLDQRREMMLDWESWVLSEV